jgi:alkylation response protein AidB-like acyl-CoA dehydrogenase
MSPQEALNAALEYLSAEVRPRANLIDQDPEALRLALRGLCDLDLMAMKRPAEFGGPSMPEPLFRTFQEEVARVSGSLAFLQTQHQSAVSMIASSENQEIREAYLPKMSNGEKLVGIGFSQLRRSGPPAMRAERVDDGFILDGMAPWVTGWSFYPEFLVGAALPDGRAVFGVVPLPLEPTEWIGASAPMRLAAMETAMTVSVQMRQYFLPRNRVAFIRAQGWIQGSDMINIALQGHFAIGCALGGLDVLRENSERKNLPFLKDALAALSDELEACRAETTKAQQAAGEETTSERLQVRAWAIDLAVRCAHAAITSSSGASNSVDHPAQRLYREALVYTVSAQTPDIMHATLDRLVRK